MSKTVNVSLVFTRDGKAAVQNFDAISYATFVALQSACVAVLAQLQAWGTNRVAALADGRPDQGPGGDCDLRLVMMADHGAGTSEVTVGYTGISAAVADQTTGLFMAAIASVMSAPPPVVVVPPKK